MKYKCNPEKYRNLAKDETKYRDLIDQLTAKTNSKQLETN